MTNASAKRVATERALSTDRRSAVSGAASPGSALSSQSGPAVLKRRPRRPSRRVSVSGTLQLRCQRCLEPMPFKVQAEELLVLAATQAEIDAEPADASAPDRVVAGKEMAVRELIEDQLILELPYAPRHEFCNGPETEAEASISPFAGLRGLIQRKQ